jgi:hypothetical protein
MAGVSLGDATREVARRDRLLVVSARDGLLLRREHDGSLVTHGDLKSGF